MTLPSFRGPKLSDQAERFTVSAERLATIAESLTERSLSQAETLSADHLHTTRQLRDTLESAGLATSQARRTAGEIEQAARAARRAFVAVETLALIAGVVLLADYLFGSRRG